MNELSLTIFNGVETIDSRLVAEAIEKPHNDLMKDIRRYSEYLGEGKISLTDFFIESTYKTSQNKEMPCYLCTRKGCEMIANKMTGAKGTIFTALYINAFHSMERQLSERPAIEPPKEQKQLIIDNDRLLIANIPVAKGEINMRVTLLAKSYVEEIAQQTGRSQRDIANMMIKFAYDNLHQPDESTFEVKPEKRTLIISRIQNVKKGHGVVTLNSLSKKYVETVAAMLDRSQCYAASNMLEFAYIHTEIK